AFVQIVRRQMSWLNSWRLLSPERGVLTMHRVARLSRPVPPGRVRVLMATEGSPCIKAFPLIRVLRRPNKSTRARATKHRLKLLLLPTRKVIVGAKANQHG